MALSERELIEMAQAGDDEAFESLILTHTPGLFRVVRRMLPDDAEAESVVQETFWRVWRSLARYKNDRPLFPYLVTVAVNHLHDRWRTSRWLEDVDFAEAADQLLDPRPPVHDEVEARELLAALAKAVDELPANYRVVIALRYQAEMRYEQIAETLDLPVNTVRTHLYRATQLLRARMEELDGTHGSTLTRTARSAAAA